MDNFTQIITYLALTSVAAERLTDIFKRAWLEKLKVNGVTYQVLSCLFGATLAFYTPPESLPIHLNEYLRAVIVGLAVSGGSSVWNDLLGALSDYRKSMQPTKTAA